MVILSSYVAEVEILVVHAQLDKAVGTVSVVLQEWTTEQLNASQRVDFHTGILGNWKIIWQGWSPENVASPMSSLRKSLPDPEEFGILSEILLCR